MSTAKKEYKRVTVKSLVDMKKQGEKISMLTAYDYSMAKIVDAANVDVILVGDSASNVMAGHETTLPITLDQMIYHASSVIRGVNRALVVVDLPFGSYQSDPKEALRSAIRIMKESGAHAIKVEGGEEIKESVRRILNAGIPVMGHLGLTPQSIYKFGTYTVRAKEAQEAKKLLDDAKMLEKLGCFGIVLEKIPASLTRKVSESITIPTIGIGGGRYADGQVLVIHDLLGMTHEFNPRFLRRYMHLFEDMSKAISQYVADVKSKDFPSEEEQY
jgi:3-methyl-2-oxobutanoate hydroxymethyltransferase